MADSALPHPAPKHVLIDLDENDETFTKLFFQGAEL